MNSFPKERGEIKLESSDYQPATNSLQDQTTFSSKEKSDSENMNENKPKNKNSEIKTLNVFKENQKLSQTKEDEDHDFQSSAEDSSFSDSLSLNDKKFDSQHSINSFGIFF
jgi:hypothetical protein